MPKTPRLPRQSVPEYERANAPLSAKHLRSLEYVALKNLGGIHASPGTRIYEETRKDAEEIVNSLHAGYLRGEIPKKYLSGHAKNRAIDRVRSLVARPDTVALDTQATTPDDGEIEYFVEAPVDTPPNTTDELNSIAALMLHEQHRHYYYRGKKGKNPWANENRMLAHLDAQRVQNRMKPSQRKAFEKLANPGRGRPNLRSMAEAQAVLREMERRGLVGAKIKRVLRPTSNPENLQEKSTPENKPRNSSLSNE